MAADRAGFLERYREVLEEAAGWSFQLDAEGVEAVLVLARDVAHGSERRNAPLATFLAGQFVLARVAGGATPQAAVDEARALARTLLSDAQT